MVASGQQLPLDLGEQERTGRDDLLVSPAIAPAVSLIDGWPDWPGPVVILVGPPGSGKSHLARIFASESGAADASGVVLNGGEPGDSDCFVLDDADRRAIDETALFHLINTVRQRPGFLLMTARKLPVAWGVTLADLRSRLAGATVVEIGPPDDALLYQVIFKLFSDRQLAVDERVIAYMIARMERSLEAARLLVEAMDRLALARGRRISRAIAAEVLDDFAKG